MKRSTEAAKWYSHTVRPRPATRPPLSKEFIDETAESLMELNPSSEYDPGLEDTLILTMKGIAAGMQNTG